MSRKSTIQASETARLAPSGYETERKNEALSLLSNHEVSRYTWKNCSVQVKDRHTGEPRKLLHNVSGELRAGATDRFSILDDRR